MGKPAAAAAAAAVVVTAGNAEKRRQISQIVFTSVKHGNVNREMPPREQTNFQPVLGLVYATIT